MAPYLPSHQPGKKRGGEKEKLCWISPCRPPITVHLLDSGMKEKKKEERKGPRINPA